jgi:hypothetical protein
MFYFGEKIVENCKSSCRHAGGDGGMKEEAFDETDADPDYTNLTTAASSVAAVMKVRRR